MQMFKAIGQNILIERSSLDKTKQTHVISRETRVEISACLVKTESRSILLLKKMLFFSLPRECFLHVIISALTIVYYRFHDTVPVELLMLDEITSSI